MQASELRVTLAEYDPGPTPQFDDYFHWDVALESSGFSGTAHFVSSRSETSGLVEQLETLDATLLVSADWRSGNGDDERFRIQVFPTGHTGRLLLEVSLSDPIGETKHQRRVTGVFGIMPNSLREFVRALRGVMAKPVEGTVVTISSDREADV